MFTYNTHIRFLVLLSTPNHYHDLFHEIRDSKSPPLCYLNLQMDRLFYQIASIHAYIKEQEQLGENKSSRCC
jgi:hypothetical protein